MKKEIEGLEIAKSDKHDIDTVSENQKMFCRHLSNLLLTFMDIVDLQQSKFSEEKGVTDKRVYELNQ